MTASGQPRLLAGIHAGRAVDLAGHRSVHGTPDEAVVRGDRLIEAVAAAGLRGRGGAGFPTAVKLRAVARARGRKALVVNGTEGEPMSGKDRVLLSLTPHLVLDGIRLAAEAVGARRIVIAVTGAAEAAALGDALLARPDLRGVRVAVVPDRYLSGEESALLRALGGGPALPTTVPPRPHERGLGRRPTLVSNAETLAQLALIARHGPDWFRALGPSEHPGSALVTLSGATPRRGVVEIALGTPAAAVAGTPRALLVGGYHGGWVSGEDAAAMTLDDASLATAGARLGTGVLVALPDDACPVAEVARVVRWLEGESAGQCGPCVHGLGAIAATVEALADGAASVGELHDLRRWCRELPGRGACHHPDGVVRFLRSALDVFADDWDDHRRHGPCDACDRPPVLAVPAIPSRLAA
jgi:NADH:ubiquinone oxidoreductase subunit F (NADH-binding)